MNMIHYMCGNKQCKQGGIVVIVPFDIEHIISSTTLQGIATIILPKKLCAYCFWELECFIVNSEDLFNEK